MIGQLQVHVARGLLEAMLALCKAKGEGAAIPICSECGRLITTAGEVDLDRSHYYCGACKCGVFPLDQKLAIGKGVWSEGVAKGVRRLAARMLFEQAAADYEALTHIAISGKSVERLAHSYGSALVERRMTEAQAAWQPPAKGAVSRPPWHPSEWRGVSLDGTMIHTREGWKEVKVGSISSFWGGGGESDSSSEGEYQPRTCDPTYCGLLRSVDEFGPLQWAGTQRRQVDWAKEVVCE